MTSVPWNKKLNWLFLFKNRPFSQQTGRHFDLSEGKGKAQVEIITLIIVIVNVIIYTCAFPALQLLDVSQAWFTAIFVCLSLQGLAMRQIRFRFDGQPINETDTPAQVGLKSWNNTFK